VNTSTTNAPIKIQTKGGDSLRYNISSANSIKKLNWLCIAGCENHRGRNHKPSTARVVFGFWFLVFWFLVFGFGLVGFWFLVFGCWSFDPSCRYGPP